MPKQVDLPAQRRSIASAAIEVIGGIGLDSARLKDVARAANVTTGAITHYFDNKDAVLEAALEEIVRRILERESRADVRSAANPVEAFVELASTFLPVDAQSRWEWRVWLAYWGRAIADERLREIHRRYYAQIIGQLAAALERNAPASDLAPAAAEQMADAIVAAIDGIGTRATLEPETWPAERQRRTLAVLITPLLLTLDGMSLPAAGRPS